MLGGMDRSTDKWTDRQADRHITSRKGKEGERLSQTVNRTTGKRSDSEVRKKRLSENR